MRKESRSPCLFNQGRTRSVGSVYSRRRWNGRSRAGEFLAIFAIAIRIEANNRVQSSRRGEETPRAEARWFLHRRNVRATQQKGRQRYADRSRSDLPARWRRLRAGGIRVSTNSSESAFTGRDDQSTTIHPLGANSENDRANGLAGPAKTPSAPA